MWHSKCKARCAWVSGVGACAWCVCVRRVLREVCVWCGVLCARLEVLDGRRRHVVLEVVERLLRDIPVKERWKKVGKGGERRRSGGGAAHERRNAWCFHISPCPSSGSRSPMRSLRKVDLPTGHVSDMSRTCPGHVPTTSRAGWPEPLPPTITAREPSVTVASTSFRMYRSVSGYLKEHLETRKPRLERDKKDHRAPRS